MEEEEVDTEVWEGWTKFGSPGVLVFGGNLRGRFFFPLRIRRVPGAEGPKGMLHLL